MATVEIAVPDIGEIDAVDVVEVLVAVGDQVAVDDPLITLESDKASMEVPSTVAGTIESIAVQVGDQVAEGAVIVRVDTGAAATSGSAAESAAVGSRGDAPAVVAAKEEVAAVVAAASTPPSSESAEPAPAPQRQADPAMTAPATPASPVADRGGLPYASPSIRKFARELGVDLGQVEGSGAGGRIVRVDVEQHVKKALRAGGSEAAGTQPGGGAIPPMPSVDFARFGAVEVRELHRIRRLSAASVHRSWLHVPHVTQFDEADITELESFRKSLKGEAEQRGVRLTPLAFFLRATVAALQEFPEVNSSLHQDRESLVLKHYYHLGVAVDTPNGLVVPVLRDIDQKGVFEIAAELAEVSERAREGKLRPADLQGASFTVSSLGGIGGTGFTPIVNAPEVGILGIARSKWTPVYSGEELRKRLILPFALSYDHRVVDGALGVRFTTFLSQCLSDVRRLLL